MSGLTPIGFQAKTVQQIIAELQDYQRSTIDGSLNSSSTGVLANLNMAFAMQLAQVWELAQEIYDSHDPNSAEGTALDAIGALTGSTRLPAAASVAELALTLGAAVTVPAGSRVSDPARPTVQFATSVAVTSIGAGSYMVQAVATETGPIAAPPGTLTHIDSPVPGWTAVTNPDAADLGNDVESDEAYRLRRQEELAAQGGSTVDGVRADVLKLPGVVSCRCLENRTDVTDVNGLPPHSFEVVVRGGDDQAIAEQIWLDKPAGIETFGTTSVNVVDSEGETHAVHFTRPTAIIINATYEVTTASPSTYVALSVRAALVLATNDPSNHAYFDIGLPVYLVRLLAIGQAVQGVVNFTMDIARAPTVPPDALPTQPSFTVAIGPREYATFAGATWSGP
jgi:uncharacterized phage protein gp47/JayE